MTNESAENTNPSETPENGATASDASGNPIVELEAKLQEEKNKYLYLYAEFDNFKKRVIKERSDLIKFGWENVARELLGVVDNLERAIEHMPEDTDEKLREGIEMIATQFHTALEKQGVKPITSVGQNFNPEIHEAMGQEPSELPAGAITKALVGGYMLHGRLLRPAKVVISTGKPTAST